LPLRTEFQTLLSDWAYDLTSDLPWLVWTVFLTAKQKDARLQWPTPVISATQEAEIRRIEVQSQPRQIVLETLYRKNPSQKRAGGVAQGVGPEFKPQYHRRVISLKLASFLKWHLFSSRCDGSRS
jgi:hypothetical protein